MMISFIVPSYNGSEILKKELPCFIDYLKKNNIQNEILIIDDGSVDYQKTLELANNSGCVFLRNEKNQGKGSAVRKGVFEAKGDYIIYTDVDIPFRYENIDKLIYYLDFKEFDIVIGDRTLKKSTYFKEIPLKRKIASSFFTFFVGRFITSGLFDTQCGLKGFNKDIAKDIFSKSCINSFAFDVEILYIALKNNCDIKRIPVQIRNIDTSSVSLLKHSIGMFIDIFRIKYNHIIGKYKNNE